MTECYDLSFLNVRFYARFSLFSFTLIKKLFSSLLSALLVLPFSYWRLLIFLPAILIPGCSSSSLAFHMMYNAYKLNKRVTIYSLDVLFSLFGTSLLFHVKFSLLLLDLHTDFSGGRSSGLVFPSLESSSCQPTAVLMPANEG